MVYQLETGEVSTMLLMVKEKSCSQCKKIKSLDEFYQDNTAHMKLGRRSVCIECGKENNKRPEVKAQKNKSAAKFRQTKRYKDYQKEYHKTEAYKLKTKRWNFKIRYGITIEEFDRMTEEQNGVCVICGKKETKKNQYRLTHLAVDHDHETEKIRGLLCHNCNVALGMVKEDIVILEKMKQYLQLNKVG